MEEKDWMDIFKSKLKEIREKYQGQLAFENIPLQPGWTTYVCDHSFISNVFRQVEGIYFLLDLCHAQVTAANTKVRQSIEEFLIACPLAKIVEIHLSATVEVGGKILEAHGMPGKQDWELLKWLVKEEGVNPKYITIEHFDEDNLVKSFEDAKILLAGL